MEQREDLNRGKDLSDPHILRIRPLDQAYAPVKPTATNSNPLGWQAPKSLPYVTHLLPTAENFLAAFSTPSDSVALFDATTAKAIANVPSFKPHPGGITALRKDPSRSSVFWSAGVDGKVQGFDLRAGNDGSSAILTGAFNSKRAFLAMDVSQDGCLVAAGTEHNKDDAPIVFWDARKGSLPWMIHTSTHAEDVTATAFHPAKPDILLSGAMDGLLSLTNTRETDEDEAVVHVSNWGCSVAKAGWITGSSKASIWSTSDMETMALWSDELDPLHEYGEIKRENTHTWYADYVVATHWVEPNSSNSWDVRGLVSWWGTNEGDVSLLEHDVLGEHQDWTLHRILKGGHDEIVRCISWDEQGRVIATGGEDGKIALWSSRVHDGDGDVEMALTRGIRRRRLSEDDDDKASRLDPARLRLTLSQVTKKQRTGL